jgi:hypothetical protein
MGVTVGVGEGVAVGVDVGVSVGVGVEKIDGGRAIVGGMKLGGGGGGGEEVWPRTEPRSRTKVMTTLQTTDTMVFFTERSLQRRLYRRCDGRGHTTVRGD